MTGWTLRLFVVACIAMAELCASRSARAEGPPAVPILAQVQLVIRLAAFDRKLPTRAAGTVRVLVVHNPGDPESVRSADVFMSTLASVHDIGGLPKDIQNAPFVSPQAIADRCRLQKVAVLYLASGLESHGTAIAASLAGVDVLSIGATGNYARQGIVVGFDSEGGKPRIVVNLAQAKKQNVDFKPDLLRLAVMVGEPAKHPRKKSSEEPDLGY